MLYSSDPSIFLMFSFFFQGIYFGGASALLGGDQSMPAPMGNISSGILEPYIFIIYFGNRFSSIHFLSCRCYRLRHGVFTMAGGASPPNVRTSKCSAGALTWKRAQAFRRQLFGSLWRGDESQKHDRQIWRFSSCFRHVEDSCWEMLHVDGRFSPIGAHQGICIYVYIYIYTKTLFSELGFT